MLGFIIGVVLGFMLCACLSASNISASNIQLINNWNKLKEYLQLNIDKPNIKFILEIMQDLEKGASKEEL